MRYLLLMALALIGTAVTWAGNDRTTEYLNQGSVINSRHNLTFRSQSGVDLLSSASGNPQYSSGTAAQMDDLNNRYGQVCVYCHTPHGANAAAAAPLWNRATPATTYTTYNQLNTNVGETYAQPGGASLSCLSCHDGQQAIDAIINMPGSGMYNATPSFATLETWTKPDGISLGQHDRLNSTGCLACHAPGVKANATDFTVFVIGTDLRNDHPVGVTYPTSTGTGTDWNTPGGSKNIGGRVMKFFDETPNSRLDKSEIRLYPAANGPSVECATCHDPHGVPSGAAGSSFNPSFLRKSIAGSNLCLTCHAK